MQGITDSVQDVVVPGTDPERTLSGLLDIGNLVGSVMRLDDILDRIVAVAADILEMPVCSVYLSNERGRLVMRSNAGFDARLVGRASFEPGEGIPGWAVEHDVMLALPDATRDWRFKPLDSEQGADVRGFICAPIRIQETVVGVLTARSGQRVEFLREHELLFETVAKMVAIVVEKARMYQEKTQAQELAPVAISLSEIAHYIKNVMFTTRIAEATVDRGLADLGEVPDTVRGAWRTLKDSNAKIQKLVGDLLNFTRESARHFKMTDLNAMVGEAVERLSVRASEQQVRLETALDDSLPLLSLDPDAFYDVLLNLLNNGIDAIPRGRTGTVTVRTRRLPSQNNVRIDVQDNGVGIAENARHRIFHIFYSTKGKEGSGIGLAATRKVVEQHGGTVEFASKEGEGTVFSVFLPLRGSARI